MATRLTAWTAVGLLAAAVPAHAQVVFLPPPWLPQPVFVPMPSPPPMPAPQAPEASRGRDASQANYPPAEAAEQLVKVERYFFRGSREGWRRHVAAITAKPIPENGAARIVREFHYLGEPAGEAKAAEPPAAAKGKLTPRGSTDPGALEPLAEQAAPAKPAPIVPPGPEAVDRKNYPPADPATPANPSTPAAPTKAATDAPAGQPETTGLLASADGTPLSGASLAFIQVRLGNEPRLPDQKVTCGADGRFRLTLPQGIWIALYQLPDGSGWRFIKTVTVTAEQVPPLRLAP